jgi:hypothetical protein
MSTKQPSLFRATAYGGCQSRPAPLARADDPAAFEKAAA